MTHDPYWMSTKSPVHLFRREYESPEIAKHISDNSFVDPAILALELSAAHLNFMAVSAYQRRLGVRPIASNKRGLKGT